MNVGKYEIVNIEFYFFGYGVKATQKYNPRTDSGHYMYSVFSLSAGRPLIEVNNSIGAPHPKKIDKAFAQEIYERARMNWEDFVEMETSDEVIVEQKVCGDGWCEVRVKP